MLHFFQADAQDAMPLSLGSCFVIGHLRAVMIAADTAILFCRRKETTKKEKISRNSSSSVFVRVLLVNEIGIQSSCRSHLTRYTSKSRRSGVCLRGFMRTVEMRRDCTGRIRETIEWLECIPKWPGGGIHTVCFFASFFTERSELTCYS